MKIFTTFLRVISFIVISGLIFVSCVKSDKQKNGLSGKTVELPYQVDLETNLSNIDAGLSFWPRYVYNDNIMVDYVEAFRLIDYLNSEVSAERRKLYGEKYENLESVVNNLDEMSNPVLIVLK